MFLNHSALDITKSIWINACAGSGKTTLLINRIIKLLLNKQENILCLAFTNTAANEMYQRIGVKLQSWQTLEFAYLESEIQQYIENPNLELLQWAQGLFSKLPQLLQISTVHSFCLNILQHYTKLDLFQSEIQIIDDLVPLYTKAVKHVLKYNSFTYIEGLTEKQILDYVLNFFPSYSHYLFSEDYRKFLNKKITHLSKTEVILNEENINTIFLALSKGSITDSKYANLLKRGQLEKVFFDSKDNIKALDKILTKKTLKLNPALLTSLESLQVSYLLREEHNRLLNSYHQTVSLLPLLQQIYLIYQTLKCGSLTYDDIIKSTLSLLEDEPWILLEIDKKLDHILIDESQDNNLEQWLIIQKISSEFFVGEGSRNINRTMFVIGDIKQSIYGFQNASPALFNLVKTQYINLIQWRLVSSNVTYRNAPAIINLVTALTSRFINIEREEKYSVFREEARGTIEIWPLFEKTSDNKKEPEYLAACKIITVIDSWVKNKRFLLNENRSINFSDILILVRRRTKFIDYLLEAARYHSISVIREDSVNVTEAPVGKILLAIAEGTLLPEDDYILVELLQSPLFALNESEIFNLTYNRQENSVFYNLKLQFPNLYYRIKEWQLISDPSSLYLHIFDEIMRDKFTIEFGEFTNFSIDEFIQVACSFSTLSVFVDSLKSKAIKLKNPITSINSLRINTVHGAKGKEAPIIFLADTTSIPRLKNFNVAEVEERPLLLSKPLPKVFKQKSKIKLQEIYDEYLRLLYVAITRAEDELYIIGTGKVEKNSWYEILSEILSEQAIAIEKCTNSITC